MSFPYTLKTGTLKDVLGKIKTTNIPGKFTIKHMESLGYRSTNDRAIISVLKQIKFLDGNGTPTQDYRNYRDSSKSKTVLAKCIKEGYSKLFDLYSDANRKDFETLKNFFSTHTEVGERAVKSMVGTFKALCEMADFENTIPITTKPETPFKIEQELTPSPTIPNTQSTPSVNINIELHLPATDDASIYDKLFESLKKHLLTK
jgi:hypothetical protein